MAVDYNTGVVTTGVSWWFVTAITDNGEIYLTDPSNGMWVLDGLDKVILPITKTVAELGTVVAGASSVAVAILGTTAAAGVAALAPYAIPAAATVAIAEILQILITDESVAGFKEFVLRAEDDTSPVSITINPTEIVFKAESGTASTPFKSSGKQLVSKK